ncbi:IclR family transcriptional regulator [Paenibacillus sp. IB182496]|uniref:IclR family transcriptional regulator n=1 Tax=Paenibacillus sabuli TaxID=2772509 RepID=A0A927GQB6_9BACL|nr:IclR family transcriptional regulator [Paenibacillus sabuli]MBD2843720.1 IclR family transcriptional regulator [Paenibacillus sabuli]
MQSKNKTLVRAMDVLQLFVGHPKLTLNQMTALCGIPKTSVHRMVHSLEEMGLLTKESDGAYRLGLLFLHYGQLVAERLDIRHAALGVMRGLRDEIGEAVHLVMREGKECIYIEKLDTDQPVRLFTKIGRKAPLYAGASSRVILAFLPEEERERYLADTELAVIGTGTITDKTKLRHALQQCRQSGYSFSRAELENYTAELSAPVFNYTGGIAAALSIAGLEVRFDDRSIPELAERLKRAAAELSYELGWNGSLTS